MSRQFINNFFKTDDGSVVLFQRPNRLAIVFIVFVVLSSVFGGNLGLLMRIIVFGVGFTWAYSEVVSGVNGFRKTLGFIVLVGLISAAYLSIL